MKYIIDTDPGIDDAIAICLAYLNKLDIIGFTLATGNVEKEKSENNLKVIQDMLGSNIKMYKGLKENPSKDTAYYAHGIGGLGYAVYPKNKRKFERKYAEEFIINSVRKYKDDLTIICLGPLTNLANAMEIDKSLENKIKHLYVMGVSLDTNLDDDNNYKEFNINCDLKSAKKVLESKIEDIKVITHEVGIKSFVEKDYVLNLRESENMISRFIGLISEKYIEFSYDHYKTIGLGTPDPTTVASVIDPSIIEFKPCDLKVYLKGDKKGYTLTTLKDNSNVKISIDFNLEKFRELFKKTFN